MGERPLRGDRARDQTREVLERLVAGRPARFQASDARLEAELEERRRHQRAWCARSERSPVEKPFEAETLRALARDFC